jgi:dTDP-glucose 4,6-dehydratase
MLLLVYGSGGWIGQQFIALTPCFKGKARVDDLNAVRKEIEEVNPTHVVSLIGRTHGPGFPTIDYLEQTGKLVENIRDNLFSPLELALLCREKSIHFTYFGTGCIFEGLAEQPFNESSVPNFFGSSYSIVKGFTDRLMNDFFQNNVLNLRIRMPIGDAPHPRNFITKITHYDKICSVENSMTVLPTLLPIALDMIRTSQTGTVNLTNPGYITHNEILDMYKEIVDPNFEYKNFSKDEQDQMLAAARSNNVLETEVLAKNYPDVPDIHEAIRKTLQNYAQASFLDKESNCILVTGGCGFIGSHFINGVHDRYRFVRVVNLDALYYCAREENVILHSSYKHRYTFVKGNICDASLVTQLLNHHKVTHVVHFAAQSHVQNSFQESLQYTQDNVLGTHTLLECVRLYGKVQRFIHCSTDEVYGDFAVTASNEETVLCPTNPYAATKAGAELIAQSYYFSYKLPIIVSRGNNVYGPNQYPEKLIPRFIQLLRNKQKMTIQGDGQQLRAFIHVSDVVSAFITLLESGQTGSIYNIGVDHEEGSDEKTVLAVAEEILKHIRPGEKLEEWITMVENRPYNDKRYFISSQKLRSLGWKPQITFEQGIAQLCNSSI